MGRASVMVPGLVALLLAACAASPPVDLPPPSAPATLAEVAARAAHTATVLPDGEVLVAGGCVVDGCGTATSQTFVLGPGGSVSRGPELSAPRDAHTATPAGPRVVLAGGFSSEGRAPNASADVVHDGVLVRTIGLLRGRGGHAAATLRDGRVVLVGGWVAPRTYTASVEVLDAAGGTARGGPPLPVAADGLDAVTLADGHVLVTGGQTAPGVGSRRAFLLDPDARSWHEVAPLREARFKHVSLALPDGRAIVLGGTPDDTTLLRTTEVFDPRTGRFEAGPPMREGRYKLAGGALLVGSRVLVAGGGRTVELLDPETGTGRTVASFAARGSFATVSPLGPDRVVVLGGYDDRITLRRTVEVLPLPTT